MPTYFLDIEAVPTSAAANAADVASASVLTFIIADSPAKLKQWHAPQSLAKLGLYKGISSFLQPTDEQISRLDTDIKDIYQQALLHKIGLFFLANPKVPGHPDDPIQIRSLGSPVIDESTKH